VNSGRAPEGRPRFAQFRVQNKLKTLRCHRMTVSGCTIFSASCHCNQVDATMVENTRSAFVSRGRFRSFL
jgi:hypothetical protein